MPVHCNLPIENTSQNHFAKLDYQVMKSVFACQNELGRLAEERIYAVDLAARLSDLNTFRGVKIELSFGDYLKKLYLDLVVSYCGIYELKTVTSLHSQHRSQLMTYMYLLDVEHGKLVNFRTSRVQTEFVNATIPRAQRVGFEVKLDQYTGSKKFADIAISVIRDWGTCLRSSLYRDCFASLMGNQACEPQLVPLVRQGYPLGNQPFWMLDHTTAFDVTTFSKHDEDYERQLRHLLQLSSLDAIHRVNIDTHLVTCSTVRRSGDSGVF
jgi:GxxExxY protein